MARVIDLKSKQAVIPPSSPEVHVAESVRPIVVSPPAPPILHPVVQEQKVFTDSGEKVAFETLRWSAPLLYRRPGTKAGFRFGFLVLIVAALIALLRHDTITTILFALIGVMVMVNSRRAIPSIDIVLDPLGVKAGRKTYRYEDMLSFWVHYDPRRDIRELSLRMKKWTSPYIKLQLAAQDPVQVQSFLLEYVPEEKHENIFVHTLIRTLGL